MHAKYRVCSVKFDGTRNCSNEGHLKLPAQLPETRKYASICEITVDATYSEGSVKTVSFCHKNSSRFKKYDPPENIINTPVFGHVL